MSSVIGDIDPANDCLRYICDRFELNVEQRYWLAFLYACCYSPTTTYYIYNEFPDFENVNEERLQNWWDANRDKLIFQTDRLRIKSSNQFVDAFRSYKEAIGNRTQHEVFDNICNSDNDENYDKCWEFASQFYTFGRFTLFIYLEMLHVLTDLPIEPTYLDLNQAVSCRNGLALAFGLDQYDTHKDKRNLTKDEVSYLQSCFADLMNIVSQLDIVHKSVWNVETTLCAYKKYKYGKRYVGYYIERSGKEIEKMQGMITEGVSWRPLWEFREETYNYKYLFEKRRQ